MELILDGNSEIGAQVLSEIGNLISIRHLFRSTVYRKFQNNRIFLQLAQRHLSYRVILYHDTLILGTLRVEMRHRVPLKTLTFNLFFVLIDFLN